MKRFVFGAAILAMVALPMSAAAWEGLTPSNPRWSGPVQYSLNSAGSADLGGFAGTEPLVRQGMDDWTRVACSSLTTSYNGSTTAPPDSRNTIAWMEGGWPYDSNAIGVTTPRFSGSNLIDAAMAMNGVNFTWTTDPGSGNRVNAYSIILHEGGHYHGLGHSGDRNSTMYFAYSGGVSAINADDETGICTLYPGGGGGTTSCATTGCPAGQVCNAAGTCVDEAPPVGGAGLTCDGCTSDAACDGLCLQYPDGSGYCGDTCGVDGDCGGSNETCEPVSDGSRRCVRRRPTDGAASCAVDPGTTPPGPGPDPDPDPGVGGECSSSRDCGSSELCNADAICVPVPSGAVGDACESNGDCDSGLCAVDSATDQTFCTDICTGDAACPGGFSCEPVGGGMNVCSPNEGYTGPDPGAGGPGEPGASPYSDGLTGSCSATSADGTVPTLGIGLLLLVLFRRRRS